jgi:hypothetical protein
MVDIRNGTDDLLRYYAELARRVTPAGFRDLAQLLTVCEQLRAALDGVSRQEIAWAAERAHELVDALVRMDSDLQALRRLKVALNAVGEQRT